MLYLEKIRTSFYFALNYQAIATEYIYIVSKMGQPDAHLLTLQGNKLGEFSKNP